MSDAILSLLGLGPTKQEKPKKRPGWSKDLDAAFGELRDAAKRAPQFTSDVPPTEVAIRLFEDETPPEEWDAILAPYGERFAGAVRQILDPDGVYASNTAQWDADTPPKEVARRLKAANIPPKDWATATEGIPTKRRNTILRNLAQGAGYSGVTTPQKRGGAAASAERMVDEVVSARDLEPASTVSRDFRDVFNSEKGEALGWDKKKLSSDAKKLLNLLQTSNNPIRDYKKYSADKARQRFAVQQEARRGKTQTKEPRERAPARPRGESAY